MMRVERTEFGSRETEAWLEGGDMDASRAVAAQRQAKADKLTEWEERVRSPDPEVRGAGWWFSPPGPPDKAVEIDRFLSSARHPFELLIVWQARVVRVIEDPMGAALGIEAKSAHALECRGRSRRYDGDAWANELPFAGKRTARKAFLNWAAFFGAVVVELENRHGRFWVFDVVLGATPRGPGRPRVQRWMLSMRRDERGPMIIQAQIPADFPMVRHKREIIRRGQFPQDAKLDWLISSNFDPGGPPFALSMYRRNARDLRRAFFGPVGLREVPGEKGGVMEFRLPRGWTLRLDYRPCRWVFDVAGEVVAQFNPPVTHAEAEAA